MKTNIKKLNFSKFENKKKIQFNLDTIKIKLIKLKLIQSLNSNHTILNNLLFLYLVQKRI